MDSIDSTQTPHGTTKMPHRNCMDTLMPYRDPQQHINSTQNDSSGNHETQPAADGLMHLHPIPSQPNEILFSVCTVSELFMVLWSLLNLHHKQCLVPAPFEVADEIRHLTGLVLWHTGSWARVNLLHAGLCFG